MRDAYYNFENRFITLANLSLADLPKELDYAGEKYILKPEFHITLLAVGQIAKIIDEPNAEKLKGQIVDDFYKFTDKNPLTEYRVTGELRLAQAVDSKSIITMTELSGIEKLFASLSEKYGVKLPIQPTHITLYTLPTDTFGIPILSYDELENISEPVDIPAIQDLL